MYFDKIIGHNKIIEQIIKTVELNRFSHAHVIAGEDGIGKSIIARETARKILGKKEAKQYADIVEYKLKNNKKSIGIDDVKSIIEETNKRPYECDNKVIIVYNADLMTEAAQNAFLKTIEEPPTCIYLILLCEKLDNILDTIQSRCEVYKLNRLKDDEIAEFLNRKYPNLQYNEKKPIIAFSDGIPGRAEKFIEDKDFHQIRNNTLGLLKELPKGELEVVHRYHYFLFKYKENWQEIFTCILSYVRDVLIYKETGDQEILINIDKFDGIKSIGEMLSFNKLYYIIDIIKNARNMLSGNVNSNLVFDSMLLKMQEV
ncbi:DNA polymerase III subunit delta' [Clostridium sp. LBM24168]